MRSYIENLKNKPEHVRRRFAFVISLSFSLIVLIAWIASYGFVPYSVESVNNTKDQIEKIEVDTPSSALSATVIGAWKDVKNMIFGSNRLEYSANNIEMVGGGR